MSQIVVVSERGLTQVVEAGPHTFYVDEPVDLGGEERGPTPYQLLLGALGACTSMTLLMYARRNGWPLERVEVRLAHSRIHARDCAECAQQDGYLDRIEKQVWVGGPLSEEQIARLGEIAERCPVARTLQSSVQITHSIGRAGAPGPE